MKSTNHLTGLACRKSSTPGKKLSEGHGTYLGLPRDTLTPQPELGFFAKALEQGLEHSMTVKHTCRNRDSRKELTLLAAVLVPPGWLIRLKKELLLINP